MPIASLKIVLAPNALKGSLSAREATGAMAEGLGRVLPQAQVCYFPVADGGDGLVDVLAGIEGLEPRSTQVQGPLGQPVTAGWLLHRAQATAWIEMASAAGLALLKRQDYNPMQASSFGVGELIRAALDAGVQHIMLGIGGSATMDGGMGLMAALGIGFRDEHGNELAPCGASLARIDRVDQGRLDARLADVDITVLCDVQNPLLGPHGAARVYAPQKGATPQQVEELETGMQHYAATLEAATGRGVREFPGAGAAGGVGAAALALLDAQLRPGAEALLDYLDFDAALEGADVVLTAEGHMDEQSAYGKAPLAVARRAAKRGIPCFMLAGSLSTEQDGWYEPFSACFSLCPAPLSLEQAMARAGEHLKTTTEQVMRCYLTGLDRGI